MLTSSAAERVSPGKKASDSLADLVEEFTNRLQEGEGVNVEEYAAAHPEHAEQLRRLLPALQVLADLSRSAPGESGATPAMDSAGEPVPGILGDYRIVREVGRGGMGVVYEAEQISLKRRVALKVLPFASAMDSRRLQRFKNEAQAAAQLHHTNIVPVFGVGCERGVHFYAMQFIEGKTAAELIADMREANEGPERAPTPEAATVSAALPTQRSAMGKEYFRKVAEWGIQAAEALEHAHELGVVHRDIKPSNLLVDARGNLWIADFGLAQVHTEGGLTMTGDVVGTLRYMSPEQALGKRWLLDHRTDIYSLGVTLYELLTLRPAFATEDRQELLQQIAFEEPAAPQRRAKGIPVELGTILLKAIAKHPEERYLTAQEMADDLGRFLEDKPVVARRPSLAQKLRKWGRRHRVLLRATAAVGLVALGMAVWMIWREKLQAQQAYQKEVVLRQESEDKRRFARQVVDEMYTQVALRWLDQEPGLQPLQKDFLRKALRFYRSMTEEQGADPAVRFETAKAYYHMANIHRALGDLQPADEDFENAISLAEELGAESPNVTDYRQLLARALNNRAVLFSTLGRPGGHFFKRSLDIKEELVKDFPSRADFRIDLAKSLTNQAVAQAMGRNWQKAEEFYGRVFEQLLEVARKEPSRQDVQLDLADLHCQFGKVKRNAGLPHEAVKSHRQALDVLQKLANVQPDVRSSPVYRRKLATTYSGLAVSLIGVGQRTEAENLYPRALSLCRELAEEFPTGVEHQIQWASLQSDWGLLLDEMGRFPEAEKVHEKALELRRALADQYPDAREYRMKLADSYYNHGSLLAKRRPVDAEKAYRQARQIQAQLVKEDPKSAEYRRDLAMTLNNLSILLRDRGDLEQARQTLEEAIHHQYAARIDPNKPGMFFGVISNNYRNLAETLIRQGDHAAAAKAAAELPRLSPQLVAAYLDAVTFLIRCAGLAEKDAKVPTIDRQALAKSYSEEAKKLLRHANKHIASNARSQNALAWFLVACPTTDYRDPARALELAQKALEQEPKNGDFLNTLGVAYYRGGQWLRAVDSLNQAIALRRGGDAGDWFFLAMAHSKLRDQEQARTWFDKAVVWMDKNKPKDEELRRFRAEAAELLDVKELPKGKEKPEQAKKEGK